MAGNIHDGIIDDDRTYSTAAMARIFGVKQARTVENWLKEIDCDMEPFGSRMLVSGHVFRLAIERQAAPDRTSDDEA